MDRIGFVSSAVLTCGLTLVPLVGCGGDAFEPTATTSATSGAGGTTSAGGTGAGGTAGTGGHTGAGGGQGGTGGAPPVPTCEAGAQEACYSGPSGTEGVGICKGGLRTCNPDGSGWSPCAGQVTPAPADDCATPVDDDCDGKVVGAGGCVCIPGVDTQACYTGPAGTLGVGSCKGGTATCNLDGVSFGACIGETVPMQEDCATPLDEDCDGLIFDDLADGCVCEPGVGTDACYTGPQGTLGVGICKGGTATCAADGKSYGACVGEVVPSPEVCATPLDENCNGLVFDDAAAGCICEPATTATCYEGPAGTLGVGVCIGGNKTCAVDGKSYGACNGEKLPAAQDDCSNQLDDDCNGSACASTVWAHLYGDSATQNPPIVAWDAQGNLLAAGTFYGSIDFGDGPHIGPGNGDIYVVKLDPTGKVLWSKAFGGNTAQYFDALTVEPSGDLVIAFRTETMTGIESGPLAIGYGPGAVVARLSGATGTAKVGISLGGASGAAWVGGLARSANGVYAVGSYSGNAFATAKLGAAQGWDAYVLRLSTADLSLLDGLRFGDAQNQAANAVATDPVGNVIVGGQFAGALTGLSALTSAGGDDAFVARLASNLSLTWVHGYGDATDQSVAAVATDATGNVFLGGGFGGTINFGGPALTSLGSLDLFAVKLNGAGGHVWSRSFGSATIDGFNDLQVGPSGEVVATGFFTSTLALGNLTVPFSGAWDAFLVKLDKDGKAVWAKGLGDSDYQVGSSVAIGTTGRIALGSGIQGKVDFGLGTLTSAGNFDAAIAVFNP